MVKTHRFKHHPVEIQKGLMLGTEQEYGGIVQLDLRTSNVATVVGKNSTGWTLLDLASLSPPKEAMAAILDVAARDEGGAGTDAHLDIATPGIIYASKTEIIYCGDVNDRWQSRIVIAELSDDDKIAIKITASGAVFDYTVKLIGWVIIPSSSRVVPPSKDLKATFTVQ